MKYLRQGFTKIILRGLATLIPVVVTAYFIYWSISLLEQVTSEALLILLPDGFYFTGLGTLILLIIIFVSGIAMSEIHAEQVFRWMEKYFSRVPVVKSVYGISKDFMSYFARQKGQHKFGQVVAVHFDEAGLKIVGFITREDVSDQSEVLEEESKIMVYLPMGYQIGGYTIVVERSRVEKLDMDFEDAMRFILTAGVSDKKQVDEQAHT